jgi:hypothetical protein
MTVIPGSEHHAQEVMDRMVTHQGEKIGMVVDVRHNIPNGRRYAFVQPIDPTETERRVPLDELRLWEGK